MVKLFKKADQTFTPNNGGAVLGLGNTAFSDNLGAGIEGHFEGARVQGFIVHIEQAGTG